MSERQNSPAKAERCPLLSRRKFLGLSAAAIGGAALPLSCGARPAHASAGPDPESTPATLIDISRCIGCGNCQRACNEANNLHPGVEQSTELGAQTLTVVERYELDGGRERFVKRQCMHCLDAACASACPAAALHTSPEGPIAYHPDQCLGCRYCMVSCPFGVPRYEWDNGLTPEVRKCMFCIERQRQGKAPACAGNCPSGALKFGKRGDLLREAHARLAAQPDHYVDHVYGEHEAGGTAMLYVSDVPFEALGFRTDVAQRPVPEYTWQVMSKIPAVAGSLALVLTGASLFTRRRQGAHHDEPAWLLEDEKPRKGA